MIEHFITNFTFVLKHLLNLKYIQVKLERAVAAHCLTCCCWPYIWSCTIVPAPEPAPSPASASEPATCQFATICASLVLLLLIAQYGADHLVQGPNMVQMTLNLVLLVQWCMIAGGGQELLVQRVAVLCWWPPCAML